nr:class I SAM-dependent methyltransferase [uncultured Methanospirillum sp.]
MKKKIIDYWNSGAGRYNQGIAPFLKSQTSNAGWKKLFSHHLGTKPLKILDVGTGPGSVSVLLAGMGHVVTAVDLSEEMLALAKKNAAACNVSVNFQNGDAEDLPFEDNTFDAVVNRWVLWTVPNPKAALGEWNRVLKQSGKLCIVDGNWYSGHKTPVQKIWKHTSRLYTSLSERRNAWKTDFEPEVIEGLWSTHATRPDDDLLLFRDVGFSDIQVYTDVNDWVMTSKDKFCQGHWGPTFLVKGVKP